MSIRDFNNLIKRILLKINPDKSLHKEYLDKESFSFIEKLLFELLKQLCIKIVQNNLTPIKVCNEFIGGEFGRRCFREFMRISDNSKRVFSISIINQMQHNSSIPINCIVESNYYLDLYSVILEFTSWYFYKSIKKINKRNIINSINSEDEIKVFIEKLGNNDLSSI